MILNAEGRRKYLTEAERCAVLEAAREAGGDVHTFILVLVYTGCRLSEARALTADKIDIQEGAIVFECLKKRRRGVFRAVPVPRLVIEALEDTHGLRNLPRNHRLWPWSRATAWRHVHRVMAAAGIEGPHACPKGLRHGYGVAAIKAGIPLNMVQRWLGHSQLSTTAIYADAMGAEERGIAERMW